MNDELPDDVLDDVLDDDACPYCLRPGDGEPCKPYCGATEAERRELLES